MMLTVWLLVGIVAADPPAEATRDERLTAEVRELAEGLPEWLPGGVTQPPEVHWAPAGPFAELIRARGGAHVGQTCVYDRTTQRIVLLFPQTLGARDALRGDEIAVLRRWLFAHELAHAWQAEQVLPRLPADRVYDQQVLYALLEGHAEWLVWRLAEAEGRTALHQRLEQRRRWATFTPERTLDDRFVYADGAAYWRRRPGTPKAEDLITALHDPRLSQRTLVHPDLEPTDRIEPPAALAVWLPDVERPQRGRLDYVRWRAWASSLGVHEHVADYQCGWRITEPQTTVTVLLFAHAAAAERVYRALSRDRRPAEAEPLLTERTTEDRRSGWLWDQRLLVELETQDGMSASAVLRSRYRPDQWRPDDLLKDAP